MNLNIIKKIPFKEKKIIVREACLMYNKLQLQSLQKNNHLNDIVFDQNKKNIKSVSIFKSLFEIMNYNEKLIIQKDFIEIDRDRHWYKKLFSKTTYYKIKHQAIDHFLLLLYG